MGSRFFAYYKLVDVFRIMSAGNPAFIIVNIYDKIVSKMYYNLGMKTFAE